MTGIRHLTTDEQRERFAAARDRGGLCAACGRTLGSDEAVYIERVVLERKSLAGDGAGWKRPMTLRDAPLGEECVSRGFLALARERPPERCEGCERPVYYAAERAGRRWVVCSKRCLGRARGVRAG